MPEVCGDHWAANEETYFRLWEAQKECKRKCSSKNQAEAHSSPKSGHKSKKAKKKSDKEGVGVVGWKKPCSPPTKSSTAATSQEQAPNTLRHSVHKATSVSGHLQMPKKREKQRCLNRVLIHVPKAFSVP